MNKTQWQQTVGVLMLTSILGGCASFGHQEKLATTLSAEQLHLTAKPQTAVRTDWWKALNDPVLNNLVDTALQQSPTLKIADARLREARSITGIAKSKDGPQVDATASVDRRRYLEYPNYGLFPTPMGGNFFTTYSTLLEANWEFDFWGKNEANIRAALGTEKALALESLQSQLVVTQSVVAQYTALQRLTQQQDVLKARLRLAQTRLALTQARANAGLLPKETLHQATAQINQLQQQASRLQTEGDQARYALAALTGQGPNSLGSLKPSALGPLPRVDDAQLTTQLLGNRPDIVAMRTRVEVAMENIKAAKAEFYPNVNLSAFIGLSSLDISKLLDRDARSLGITPAISLPIFHSGQLQSNLNKQQSAYNIAVESYNQSVLNALRDVATAISNFKQSNNQFEDASEAHGNTSRVSDSTTLRYKAGLVSKLDVLNAQDGALTQQLGKIDAAATSQLAWVTLNTALGGGFTTNADTTH